MLIRNNMFVVGVLYCVQLLSEETIFKVSYDPSAIINYIGCLIKTQFNNSIQTIFQGSSPWATLILNSMFVLGVHYCVQLLSEAKKNKIILSFPFPFLC